MEINAPEFEDGGFVIITLSRKPGNRLAFLAETVYTPAEFEQMSNAKIRAAVKAHVDYHTKAKELTADANASV